MNQIKLKDLIKSKQITIPLYFLKRYKEFNLTIDELVLLLYLYDQDGATFDPNKISMELEMDLLNVMEIVSNLGDKGLINVVTKKNDNEIMEEVFDLSPLFDKITIKQVELLNSKEEEINLYKMIEDEFGRKLTPLECEMVDDWQRNNYSNDLIKEAVKEASINGVSNLRYIDKILFEWNKKGYQKSSDIKKKEEVEKVEIYNCNWLDDDDEI